MASNFRTDVAQQGIATDRAGELVKESSRKTSEADALSSKANRDLFTEIAGTSIQTYFDMKKEDFGRKVEDQISRLEDYGEVAQEAQTQLELLDKRIVEEADKAAGVGPFSRPTDVGTGKQVDLLAENVKQHMEKFVTEALPEIKALQGRILSRDTVIRNIAALTKQYIAEFPGMASMYRQKAAELTGISSVDAYPVNQALTTASARDRLAQAEATKALELQTAIAKYYGYSSLDQITPADENFYMGTQALKNTAERLKIETETQGYIQTETDKIHAQGVSIGLAGTAYNLTGSIVKMMKEGADPNTKWVDFTTQIKPDVFAALASERERAKRDVYKRMSQLENPLSQDMATKLIAQIDNSFADMEKVFNDSEQFEYFTKLAEGTNLQYETFRNAMILAQPFLEVLKVTGIGPDLITKWYAEPGTAEEKHRRFTAQFGKAFADGIQEVVTNPKWSIVQIQAAKRNGSSDVNQASNVAEQADAAGMGPSEATPEKNRMYMDSQKVLWEDTPTIPSQALGQINAVAVHLNERDVSQIDLTAVEKYLNSSKFRTAMELADQTKAKNMLATGVHQGYNRYAAQMDLLLSKLTGDDPAFLNATLSRFEPGAPVWNPDTGQFEVNTLRSEEFKKQIQLINTYLRISKAVDPYLPPEQQGAGNRLYEQIVSNLKERYANNQKSVDVRLTDKGILEADKQALWKEKVKLENTSPENRDQARLMQVDEELRMTRSTLDDVSGAIERLREQTKRDSYILNLLTSKAKPERPNTSLDKPKVEPTSGTTVDRSTPPGEYSFTVTPDEQLARDERALGIKAKEAELDSAVAYQVVTDAQRHLDNIARILESSDIKDKSRYVEMYRNALDMRFNPEYTDKLTDEQKTKIASEKWKPLTDEQLKELVNE